MYKFAKVTAGLALCLLALASGGAANAQGDDERSITSKLSKASVNLYLSDAPKTIRLDPASGMVLSVTAGEPIQTLAVKSNCTGDVACWTGLGPTLSYGFSGTTTTGQWGNRGAFQTRNYTAVVCWTFGPPQWSATHCTPEAERAGKNSSLIWGQTVTGVKVSLKR